VRPRAVRRKETKRLEHRAEAERIVDALLNGPPGLLGEVHAILESRPFRTPPPPTPEGMTDKLMERRHIEAAFGMLARRRALEEGSVPEGELAGLPGYSREGVAGMRAGGGLLAVEIAFLPGFHYPRWQFDAGWRPLAVLPRLTALTAEMGYRPRELDRWMNSELPDGGTPLEMLREGSGEDEVVRLLRRHLEIVF